MKFDPEAEVVTSDPCHSATGFLSVPLANALATPQSSFETIKSGDGSPPSLPLTPMPRMSSPVYSNISPKDGASSSNDPEQRDDEVWSGEDEEADGDGDGDVDSESRKRKRPRHARPMSVSCELCKVRNRVMPRLPRLT